MNINLFVEGFILGFGMIVFIGPVFFLLLSISLEKGILAGLLVALGIILSDIVYVILCHMGITSFLNIPSLKFYLSFLGGLLLILIGIKYIFKPPNFSLTEIPIASFDLLACFTKGFLINFINPFVFLVWLGILTSVKEKPFSNLEIKLYLTGVLLGIFVVDFFKVILSKQLKKFLKPKIFSMLIRFAGISLIGFGFKLLFLLI
jgi:threonine/homoserine/homoserine lactone efflux protein